MSSMQALTMYVVKHNKKSYEFLLILFTTVCIKMYKASVNKVNEVLGEQCAGRCKALIQYNVLYKYLMAWHKIVVS